MFGKRKRCGECGQLAKFALLDSLGVLVYTAAVSWVMLHGKEWFGADSGNVLQPIAVLLLLVLSVAVVGVLIFGKPTLLYLDGKKQEGVKLLICTLFILFLLTAIVLAANVAV